MNERTVLMPPQNSRVSASQGNPWPTELHWDGGRTPDPVKAIVVALNLLPSGHPQMVRTKSDPSHLLRNFPREGVSVDTTQLPDGSWRTVLRRKSSERTASAS